MNRDLTRANNFYEKSKATSGLNHSVRKSYLEQALSIYHSETREAAGECRPSLWRNIAQASLSLAKFFDQRFDLKMIIYHLSEAVKYFTMAWMGRTGQQWTQWKEKIEELVLECFELAFNSIDGDVESRIPNFPLLNKIEKAIDSIETLDGFRVRFHLAKGQYFYRCGIISNEQTNFKATCQLIEYSREESQMALKYSKTYPEAAIEVNRLEEDISFLRYSCESLRLRAQGDNLFSAYVDDTDEIDFDMMWNVLDKYKAAEMCCREIDLENEAIALSRQGRIFAKVFLMKARAKEYYRTAFQLVNSMSPRNFSNAPWFKECQTAMNAYQKEQLEEEERQKAMDRAPYLLELKPELDKLNEVHQKANAYKLLEYVYKTHPPKHGKNNYDAKTVSPSNIKKTLIHAITQYHPDKQVTFGMKWKVLSEEITKCLNRRYAALKGCP